MPKNIVVLSDGTGQDGGRGHDSNIYKLFRMLEDRTDRQIVYYDQGLGTDWRKVTGNAFGAGFSNNILQGYQFIYDNYEAGDKIFLLGFSRGAATVRSLANFIHYFGILPKARPELIRRAWKLYREGKQERVDYGRETAPEGFLDRAADRTNRLIGAAADRVESFFRESLNEKAKQFVREHPNQWASIEFLGVWDTVPALGLVPLAGLNVLINNIPWFRHRFHDFKLHESVNNAYHALAIDDDRLWFHPTIWKECSDKQNVQQVWFSGSHTDVGGGFMAAGLSDVSLEWMVEKALNHGLHLYLRSRSNWNFVVAPDATDREHPPRTGFGKVYKFGLRDTVWDWKAVESYGPPKLHRSVLDRAAADPGYRPWILKQYGRYLLMLPGQFEKWLNSEYEKGYDRAFEAYAEQMMGSGEGGETALAAMPENREAWLAANTFGSWLTEHYPEYLAHRQKVRDDEEMLRWLENYKPFKEWLATTYPPFEEGEGGPFLVEPYTLLFEYEDEEGRKVVLREDLDDAACMKRGLKSKRYLLRDYDQETLQPMIDRGLDRTPRGAFANLLERVVLPKPIVERLDQAASIKKSKSELKQWMNRYFYDRERWYGNKSEKS